MAAQAKNNPAAYDPAVLYWDWEKTKTGNHPPGLKDPQSPKGDNQYPERLGQPRAGTLKRVNAFVGDENPRSVRNHDGDNNKTGVMNDGNSAFELKAKSDFPESLYSKAKRKTIEDMGNRFMRTIQDLDKGNPNEQVDFNPILEKHWSELAEFYSAQVSTVRMLKRKLKAPLPSTTWDPKPTPQVQLPTYLLAQLKELKLHPFPFMRPGRNPDPAPLLGSGEAKLPVGEDTPADSLRNETTVVKSLVTGSEYCRGKMASRAQDSIGEDPNIFPLRETNETTFSPCPSEDRAVGMAHYGTVKNEKSLQTTTETTTETRNDLRVDQDIPQESAHTNLDSQCSKKTTNGEILAEDVETINPEDSEVDTSEPDNVDSTKLLKKENDPDSSKEETEDTGLWGTHDAITIDPVAVPPVGDGCKALTEGMEPATTGESGLRKVNETETKTDSNTPDEERNILETEKESGNSNDDIEDEERKGLLVFSEVGPDPECPATANSQQPHSLMEDQLESDEEDIYGSDSNYNSSKILEQDLENEDPEIIGTGDISKADSLVDTPYDTISCTPAEITIDQAGATLLPLCHPITARGQVKGSTGSEADRSIDLATAEPLPHDSSDSFSVSEDSYLFSGSSSNELEKLQIEVTDHLEKAKRMGGSLVAKWIDEFGVQREKSVEADELPDEVAMEAGIKNEEGDGDHGEAEDGIEEYGTEYMGDGGDNEDEDGDNDEQMEEIVARIALEHDWGKEKHAHTVGTSSEEAKETTFESDSFATDENEDTTDRDEGEEKFEENVKVIMKRVYEKELSVVDEEEDEEGDGDEKDEASEEVEEAGNSSDDGEDSKFREPIGVTGNCNEKTGVDLEEIGMRSNVDKSTGQEKEKEDEPKESVSLETELGVEV